MWVHEMTGLRFRFSNRGTFFCFLGLRTPFNDLTRPHPKWWFMWGIAPRPPIIHPDFPGLLRVVESGDVVLQVLNHGCSFEGMGVLPMFRLTLAYNAPFLCGANGPAKALPCLKLENDCSKLVLKPRTLMGVDGEIPGRPPNHKSKPRITGKLTKWPSGQRNTPLQIPLPLIWVAFGLKGSSGLPRKLPLRRIPPTACFKANAVCFSCWPVIWARWVDPSSC